MKQQRQSDLLMGERLSLMYERFDGILTIGAAVAAAIALVYLAFGWVTKLLNEGNWVALFIVASLVVGSLGALAWAVRSRPRIALPIAIIFLAFVIFPLFGVGGWRVLWP